MAVNWRARLKRLLSRFFLVPQFCSKCGQSDGFDFYADDDLWNAVWLALGSRFGVLCLACFVRACEDLHLACAGRVRLILGHARWYGLTRAPDPQDVRAWGGRGIAWTARL